MYIKLFLSHFLCFFPGAIMNLYRLSLTLTVQRCCTFKSVNGLFECKMNNRLQYSFTNPLYCNRFMKQSSILALVCSFWNFEF